MRIPILRVGTHGDFVVTEALVDQLIANTVLPDSARRSVFRFV